MTTTATATPDAVVVVNGPEDDRALRSAGDGHRSAQEAGEPVEWRSVLGNGL